MNLLARTKNILNFTQLREISKETSLINMDGPFLIKRTPYLSQIIRNSSSEEIKLFRKSKRLMLFKEHVFVRAITLQGIKFDSKILKGSFDKFENIDALKYEFKKLDFKIRKNGFDLKSFEIIHTHPTGCYVEKMDGNMVISLGGISEADLEVSNYFNDIFNVRVELRAICPGNITFCSA